MRSLYDFSRFFEDYGIDYSGPNSRGFLEINCPWCLEKNKHGGIHAKNNYYHCWKCGDKSIHQLVFILTNINWNSISRQYKLNPDQYDLILNKINKEKIHADKIEFPIGTTELKERHKEYLRKRGFDPDYLIKKYKIMATGPAGIIKDKNLFAYRIIIPIFYKNRIISIQARDYTDLSKLRYITYPEDMEIIHHKNILYNLDNVLGKHVIVVEGVTDVWKLGDCAAATFGTGYTNAQVNLLASEFEKVSIIYDNEPEAQEKARKLCKKLQGLMIDTEIILLPEGMDPGSLSIQDAKEIVREIIK